jgi:hypothetical protein
MCSFLSSGKGSLVKLAVILFTTLLPPDIAISSAQKDAKLLTPPIINVELSGYEPPPLGIPSMLLFGGNGGRRENEFTYYPSPEWLSSNFDLYVPSTEIEFTACGYNASSLPKTTITLPDGATQNWQGKAFAPESNCWQVPFPSWYGMQLGQYSITLDSPVGKLSHTFTIDIDPLNVGVTTFLKDGKLLSLIYGLPADEDITVKFYDYFNNKHGDSGAYYIASRPVRIGSERMLAVNLDLTRSAPFKAETIRLYLQEDFTQSPDTFVPCEKSPAPRLTVGKMARITPGMANVLRDQPGWISPTETGDEGSEKIGRIFGGEKFMITGGPLCGVNNRTYWRVLYDGKVGWTAEGEGSQYWMEPLP